MASKYEHVSTGAGFKVRNGATETTVINQDGTLKTGIVATATLADDAVTSAKLDPTTIQYVEVALTAAQINALYTTSVEVIPAVAGKIIVLESFVFDLTGTATQFTGGGVVNLQYDSTANGAGTTLHADIAATVVTGATGRVITHRIPKDLSAIATASITGKGVYIGAKTANFAAGTGTAVCKVSYRLV